FDIHFFLIVVAHVFSSFRMGRSLGSLRALRRHSTLWRNCVKQKYVRVAFLDSLLSLNPLLFLGRVQLSTFDLQRFTQLWFMKSFFLVIRACGSGGALPAGCAV